jgi:hypothetical protein
MVNLNVSNSGAQFLCRYGIQIEARNFVKLLMALTFVLLASTAQAQDLGERVSSLAKTTEVSDETATMLMGLGETVKFLMAEHFANYQEPSFKMSGGEFIRLAGQLADQVGMGKSYLSYPKVRVALVKAGIFEVVEEVVAGVEYQTQMIIEFGKTRFPDVYSMQVAVAQMCSGAFNMKQPN